LLAEVAWIINSAAELRSFIALRCFAMDGRPSLFVSAFSALVLLVIAGGVTVALAVWAIRSPRMPAGAGSIMLSGWIVTDIYIVLSCNIVSYRAQDFNLLIGMAGWTLIAALAFRCGGE
jgi:hypothetical protein